MGHESAEPCVLASNLDSTQNHNAITKTFNMSHVKDSITNRFQNE